MERQVAEVFPPGEYIKDELAARGWTQSDLAQVLGRSSPKVSELINGKRRITIRTARELAAAFGTSAQVWLNLENQWRLRQDRSPVDAVERRARIKMGSAES
jgi:HTH-type transcriptional regulator/antitoxin HigA